MGRGRGGAKRQRVPQLRKGLPEGAEFQISDLSRYPSLFLNAGTSELLIEESKSLLAQAGNRLNWRSLVL